MSINPLHHENNDREIIDILSCNIIPGLSTTLIFSFGSISKVDNDEKYFTSALFAAPVRVDAYDDEGSNLSFESESGFIKVTDNIPGLIVSKESKYLKEYLEKEDWVEAHSGETLSHYVLWSYGGGVIHILSSHSPILEVL